jgi:RNA polymerase sigma-70 factor (ECF subfamily)
VPSITAYAELDDRALMAAHVAGDPDAFAEIVRRHRDRLWAVALRTLGDPEEAADAVQDALISAFRSAASYRGDAAVTTWLHRVVVNACLDRVRRRKARPAVALPDDLANRPDVADPHDRHDESLIALDVRQALQTLPEDQRAAIVLVDILGHSVDDAATILGIPNGTVKSRCFRGRARLLPLLEHLRNRDSGDGVTPESGSGVPTGSRATSPRDGSSSEGTPTTQDPAASTQVPRRSTGGGTP